MTFSVANATLNITKVTSNVTENGLQVCKDDHNKVPVAEVTFSVTKPTLNVSKNGRLSLK